MARAIRPTLVLLVAAAAVTLALMLTGVLGGAGPTPAGAATKAHHSHAIKAHHSHAIKAHHSRVVRQRSDNGEESESAAEPAGEAQPGHEDPQGQQVDHQCPPDCAPGELP